MAIKQHKVYFFIQSIADSLYLFAFWSPCLLCLIIPCLLSWCWSLSKVLMLFLLCFSYQRLVNWNLTKASFIIFSSKRSFETSKWCIVFLFWTRSYFTKPWRCRSAVCNFRYININYFSNIIFYSKLIINSSISWRLIVFYSYSIVRKWSYCNEYVFPLFILYYVQ